MNNDFSESVASITVLNSPTVNCPVTFSGFKQGVVTVPKNILKPSNLVYLFIFDITLYLNERERKENLERYISHGH